MAVALASAAVLPAEHGVSAGGSPPVKPRQHFTAGINGSPGVPNPATILMACFGPILPGQTGHPFGGQTIAVRKVTRKTPGAGYTGTRATSIGGFFGLPPPAAPPASTFVSFIRYGQQEIPTSLVLPCAGPGQVTFIGLPLDPSERDVAVPVVFVGQP
ncbi:MAG: hypothetical protein E6J45_04935 [Chloroflexi bacterium]|nr:MAG: hypothetical protein E6J45_04935 [Chloroflexota bacterium]